MLTEVVDALEVATDGKGEFEIPRRTHALVWGSMEEPEFVIFYQGYGYYPVFQLQPVGKAMEAAFREHTILALPRWNSKEERTQIRDLPVFLSRVPSGKMRKLVRFMEAEGQALGLSQTQIGR
jgi:hypothetical protein